jgi:hypothetical protein
VLAPIIVAAIGWVVCTTLVASIALVSAGRLVHFELIGMLLFHATVVCYVALYSSRTLIGRARAEAQAELQHQLVGLLLKDFEGSSRDWLWETVANRRLRASRLSISFVRRS